MADFEFWIDADNVAGGRDGSQGAPYNTADECWEARQGLLTGGNRLIINVKGLTDDTSSPDFDSWPGTGSGDQDLLIRTWDDADNEGKSDTAVAFDSNFYALVHTANGGTALEIDPITTANTQNIEILDIQIKGVSTDTANMFVCNIGDGGNANANVIFRRTKLVYDPNGQAVTFPRIFRLRAGCQSLLLENDMLVGAQSQINQSGSWFNGNTQVDLYNNAFLYATDGSGTAAYTGVSSGFTVNSENNLILGGDGAATGTFNTENFNASDFAGDRGANGVAAVFGDVTTSARGDTLNPTPTGSPAWETAGRTGAGISDHDILNRSRNTTGNTAIGPVAIGEGSSALQGTGTVSAAVAVSGDASVTRQGAGTASLSVTVSGDATVTRQGAGEASAQVLMVADAGVRRSGSGEVSAQIAAAANAGVRRSGAGAADLAVTMAGDGAVAGNIQGSGIVSAAITATGDAGVRRPAAGAASIAATLAANGFVTRQGSGQSSFAILAAGDAGVRKTGAGAISTAFDVAGDAIARKLASGEVALSLFATGSASVRKSATGTSSLTFLVSGDAILPGGAVLPLVGPFLLTDLSPRIALKDLSPIVSLIDRSPISSLTED